MEKNWDSRNKYGKCRRNKINQKTSGCNSIEGMLEIKKAEDCNTKVKTDTFNLDEMSTQAILAFVRIKAHTVREKVFSIIKNAIVTDTDPFTHKPLGYCGITEPMVYDLIELTKTGKILPKAKPAVPLTSRDIDLLDVVKGRAMAGSKTDGEKVAIETLYKKIRGI
jgi:hypothetical protein